MTVKELSQLYYLGKEIELCQKQLAELEAQRGISAINMDGMPHTKGMTKSQIEQLAAEIVDLKAIIHAKQIECIHERNRLERYIADIPDSEIRNIFTYRFVNRLSWDDVATCMGPGNTPERVRQVCSRYTRQAGE